MNTLDAPSADPVYRSFEQVAETLGDLVEPVYSRYFARDPAAAALMSHMDVLTRGRMLEEVLRLLMSTDFDDDQGYLDFEIRNHQGAYQVEARMYGELLEAVRDTVADAIGSEWDEVTDSAWRSRIDGLLLEIAGRVAVG